MTRIFIVLCFLTSVVMADVISTTGQLKFDTQMDNQAEMTLNATGLGIGITPSANLHVNGNAIVTNQVFVGGSSGSSNLNVNGTIGYGFQTVTSSTTLSGNSIVLADTSSGNIVLSLPEASSYDGRNYTIKKTSTLNSVFIRDGGFIDTYSDVTLSVNQMGSLTLISYSGNWQILNMSGNGDLIAADNLVGWWKLDETSGNISTDSSIFNNQGDAIGFSSTNIGVNGVIGKALDLDGVNDYVDLGDTANPSGDFSISLWTIPSGSPNSYVISNWSNPYVYSVRYWNSSGFSFSIRNSLNVDTSTATSNNPNADEIYHIVTTANTSTGKITLWVNGIEETSQTGWNGTWRSTVNSDHIGLKGDTSTYYGGKIDDVRFYNKSLTTSEIQALYNQGL